jgi:hypothetical protein
MISGAKAGDLPIDQPTKCELVIDIKAVKKPGVKIPGRYSGRLHKVIE